MNVEFCKLKKKKKRVELKEVCSFTKVVFQAEHHNTTLNSLIPAIQTNSILQELLKAFCPGEERMENFKGSLCTVLHIQSVEEVKNLPVLQTQPCRKQLGLNHLLN